FNRIMLAEHPFHAQGGANYPFFQSVDWAGLVKSVTAPGRTEVRFTLSRPDSSFLSNLATDFAAILSAEYGQQLQASGDLARLDSHPIGTGPFRFKEYQKDVLIRYYRHRHYWRELAKPEQLVFDIVPNNA